VGKLTQVHQKIHSRRREVMLAGFAAAAAIGVVTVPTFTDWASSVHAHADTTADGMYLEWSTDDSSWVNPTAGTGIASFAFAGADASALKPGDVVTLVGYLKNSGTNPIVLTAATLSPSGAMFSGADPATVVFDPQHTPNVGGGILPGQVLQVQATVTIPADWDSSYVGAPGAVDLNISASESH
jgi:hypothetical protein